MIRELSTTVMLLAPLAPLALLDGTAGGGSAGEAEAIQVVLGVETDGRATEQWLAMIRKRLPAPSYASLAPSRKPLTPQERLWADLIRSRAAAWQSRRDLLADPFPGVQPPRRVVIVMGNRGGDDAFTHDPRTIGFDLAALQATYGDATDADNPDRVDRFLDHEYTHLLQKAWMADHPYSDDSLLEEALLDIWLEGIGNYRSLSPRWRADRGRATETTAGALARLEPRFAARMAALACASEADGRALMADLSRGRFEDKWGALTAALWLDVEASVDDEALRRFVAEGPDGVWALARRHISPPLKAVVTEAREAAALCAAD